METELEGGITSCALSSRNIAYILPTETQSQKVLAEHSMTFLSVSELARRLRATAGSFSRSFARTTVDWLPLRVRAT